MSIAENIARMRKGRGLTQEALAEVIGVSAQTISKWETATTYPDVSLLPVIADVFGVTIDAIYGRESEHHSLNAANAIDRVMAQVSETIVGTIYDPEKDGRFEDRLAHYRKVMQTDPRQRSVIENDRDVLYYREELGEIALRHPEAGWNSLFAREDVAAFLRLLADEDFRRAMQTILARRLLTFTLPSLMQRCGAGDAAHLEKCLQESRCFARRELLVDEAPLVFYELVWGERQLFLIFAVLTFAREYLDYQSMHYCFIGNGKYFTP